MSSKCDTCRLPGRCCAGFPLIGGPEGTTMLEQFALMASAETPPVGYVLGDEESRVGAAVISLPFQPLYRRPSDGAWFYWCVNLLPNGRCGDYENRPWLCRHYQPGQDGLCAEFVPPPPGPEIMRKDEAV